VGLLDGGVDVFAKAEIVGGDDKMVQ